MKRKVLSILMILLIISMSTITVFANPLGVQLAYDAQSVVAGLLTSYGYTGLSSTEIQRTFNELPPELQMQLAYVAQNNCYDRGDGFAYCQVDNATLQAFNSWYMENYADGTLPEYSFQWPYKITYPLTGYLYDYNSQLQSIISSSPYLYQVAISYTGTGPASGKLSALDLYESDSPIYCYNYLYLTNEKYEYKGTGVRKTEFRWSNGVFSPIYTNYSSMTITATGTNKYYWSNVPLDVKNSSMNTIGNVYYTTIPKGYAYNDYYSPDKYPLPVILGTPTIAMPVNDAPDTNVQAPPNNSISNPITLETVLAGYGSIDNFFEQGGQITLADGTVIGKTPDMARTIEPVLENTGTGAIDTDVSGIKSLVQSIAKTLTAIRTAVTDWFSISDFTLSFEPLKVNFKTVFPFCIPFDFYNLIAIFSASPSDFSFDIDLHTQYFDIDHTVDLSPFMPLILFFRYVVIAWFGWILISKTRDMIKW